MSEFKKNNVPDKYRFRFYRRNGQHPFLVVMVETKEDETIIDKIKIKNLPKGR